MPTLAASICTRRGVAGGRGLAVAEKRGVRRRVGREDGVADLASCRGVTVSCRRGSVRCWRCWTGGIGGSWDTLGLRGDDGT
jgi:hypothetical protein